MTVPMASCNAVSTICSHYGCQGMCEVSLTHHKHLVFMRQELALIKMITFCKKLQTVNYYFSVTSQHKGNIRLYKRFFTHFYCQYPHQYALQSFSISSLFSLPSHSHTLFYSFLLLLHTTSGKVQNTFT